MHFPEVCGLHTNLTYSEHLCAVYSKLNNAVNRQDASFESYIESKFKKTYTAPGVNGPCFSAGI